jgi:predicted Zn finger-like uncharacterized protein
MSLITCCPACGTMFRVVPDQLKISEGWVRCGHCAEVFDATAHMMSEAPAGPPPELDRPTAPVEMETSPGDIPTSAAPTAPAPVELPEIDSVPPEPDSELPSPLDQPFVFRRSDLGDTDDVPAASPPLAPPVISPSMPMDLHDEDHALHDVSFMQAARRQAFWRKRSVRVVLAVSVLLLGVLFALQVAVHDRDRLALAQPGLRPFLQQLCSALGCRIEAPRQIETLAIEASAFSRLRGDAYRLNFTLKNNAGTPVAVPSMELTLTDSQDQPVLRRVLTPPELGASAPVIPAGSEWSTSIALAVNANGQGSRVAGYRLLAFYP